MNKEHLIVAWVMAIFIISFILCAPKYYILYGGYRGNIKLSYQEATDFQKKRAVLKTDWDFVFQSSLITLIIGGLLIYTLRDKKTGG